MYDTAELENEKRAYPTEEGRRIQVEYDMLRASLGRLEKEAARLLAARLRGDRCNIDRIAERLSDLCDRLET